MSLQMSVLLSLGLLGSIVFLLILWGSAEILIPLLGEPMNPFKLWGQAATKGASKITF